MTCRHRPGDPDCSSSPEGARRAAQYAIDSAQEMARRKLAEVEARTPDAARFEIDEVEEVGGHLVLKVKYPNCAKCAYEGVKVMVFLDATVKQVLRWRKIDPHFRDPKGLPTATEAPSPAARFPGSDEGWKDALAYARSKARPVMRGGGK